MAKIGRPSALTVTLASDPEAPSDEVLSRILFGSSITDISVTEAAQLGIALASLVGAGALLPVLGTEFVPKADFSETSVNFMTPVGSSIETTEARARQVVAILREQPEVMYTVVTINSGNAQGRNVALSEVVKVERATWDGAIHHKDLLPVAYVMADEAGELDSPLYGMFDVVGQVDDGALDAKLTHGRRIATAP